MSLRLCFRPIGFVLVLSLVASLAPAQVSFRVGDTLSVMAGEDAGPQAMALADLDNQTGPDLVIVEPEFANVLIWLNDGQGGFSEETSGDVGDFPVAVATAEINLDPRRDLVVVNRDSATVSVLLQDADFFFEPLEGFEEGFAVDAAPVGLVVADLDGDRRADLAVLSDATIHLLKGVGNGTFNDFPTASISTGSGTGGNYAIAAGDFNNDRSVDLAVSSRGTRRLSVLLSNGNGTFQAPRIFGLARTPGNLLVGNLRGDLAFDDVAIVTSDDLDAEVNLFVSDGSGGFTQEITGAGAGEVSVLTAESLGITGGDLDNDGKLDLVVTNLVGAPGAELLCRQPSSVCFQPELPSGLVTNPLPDEEGFQLILPLAALSGPARAVLAEDVNGDRLADVLTLEPDGESVRVILNTTGQVQEPTPTATIPGGTPPPPTSDATATVTPTRTLTPTPLPTSTPTLIPTVPYTVCTTNDAGQPNVLGRIIAVASGDFNRDGSVDIVAADNSGNRVVVLLTAIRTGASTACEVLGLSRGAEIAVGAPTSLKASDLDGDGRLDLAVAGSAGVSVFYGDGTGGFAASPANPMPAGGSTGLLAISDINRDGGLDILVAQPGSSSNGVAILMRESGNRRGYQPACTISVGRSPDVLLAQDLSRDGRPDFAIASGQTTDLSVFQQLGSEVTPGTAVCPSGTSGFRGLTPFNLPDEPRALVAGSFEQGDAVPDLAAAMRGGSSAASGRLAVVLGRAAGSNVSYQLVSNLLVPGPSGAVSIPSAIGSGDINRDGRADLMISDERNDALIVFLAQADGSYGPNLIPQLIFGSRPVHMEVADIDADGRPDIILANAGREGEAGGVSILVSSRPPNTPTPLPTFTPTMSGTPTQTPTETPPPSLTATLTETATPTPTRTPTNRPPPSASPTKTLKPGTINLSEGTCAVSTGGQAGNAFVLWLVGIALAGLRSRSRKVP